VEADVACCEVLPEHFLEIFIVQTGSSLRPLKHEAGWVPSEKQEDKIKSIS
jgi:hypothetical protein